LTYGIGRFGDPTVPLAVRALAAQTGILAGALSALFLAAVFAALRESEGRLRSILNAADVVAWEVDLICDTVHATGPSARFLNSQPGLQPFNVWTSGDAVHPADRESVRAGFAAALQGKAPFRVEFRLSLPDGGMRWLASEGTVVRDKDGRPLRVLGVNHDITDRKNAEAALRESEARMRLAAQAANIGFWVLDLETQRVRGTPEYFALFGLPPSDEPVALEQIRALYPLEDRSRIISAVEESIKTGRSLVEDRRITRPDGNLRWLHIVSDTRRDATGRPVARYGVTFDITERKESEEHVQLLMREISHRAKNLLTVVQVMARQTAGEVDPHVFAEHFGDRLAGLAASHDLLVKSDWHGVDTADLVRSQLAHFAHLVGTRVTLEGPPLKLRPAGAQALGMALRELATNAAKYGALSNAAGVIRIAWDIVGSDRGRRFRMRWLERDGPRPRPPTKRGFGHTVMVEMLKQALEAEVRLDYPSSGAIWELDVQLDGPLGRGMILN
jgi:PAS domain S-box-containing protein